MLSGLVPSAVPESTADRQKSIATCTTEIAIADLSKPVKQRGNRKSSPTN